MSLLSAAEALAATVRVLAPLFDAVHDYVTGETDEMPDLRELPAQLRSRAALERAKLRSKR